MLSFPLKVWEKFFPKKAFHGGTHWLPIFMGKVAHWFVDGDVGDVRSYLDQATSLLKKFSWEAGGRVKLFMVPCHTYIYETWKNKEVARQGRS